MSERSSIITPSEVVSEDGSVLSNSAMTDDNLVDVEPDLPPPSASPVISAVPVISDNEEHSTLVTKANTLIDRNHETNKNIGDENEPTVPEPKFPETRKRERIRQIKHKSKNLPPSGKMEVSAGVTISDSDSALGQKKKRKRADESGSIGGLRGKSEWVQATTRNDDIRNHTVHVAASGLFASITLEHSFAKKGSMGDWVDATIVALAESNRAAAAVAYLSTPSVMSPPCKPGENTTALQVQFRSPQDLEAALGPIMILDYATEVERYGGGTGCVFKVRLGTWAGEEKKIYMAFELLAMTQIIAWGWRHIKETRTDVVMQTMLPPGKVVSRIQVDGWWLECEREEGGICCCCRGAHSCFDLASKCTQFESA